MLLAKGGGGGGDATKKICFCPRLKTFCRPRVLLLAMRFCKSLVLAREIRLAESIRNRILQAAGVRDVISRAASVWNGDLAGRNLISAILVRLFPSLDLSPRHNKGGWGVGHAPYQGGEEVT